MSGSRRKEIATNKSDKKYAGVSGFVQFDPHDPDVDYMGRVDINGQEAFKFSLRGVGFTGQPPVTVTLFPEWSESFDKIQQGSFVAVEGRYNMGSSKDGSKKYHNLTAFSLFVDGELQVKDDSERKEVVRGDSDDDLPF